MENEILERLYHSEINFQIETIYDSGFFVRLGDFYNGTGIAYNSDNLKNAVIKLAELGTNKYPESEFAKWWKERSQWVCPACGSKKGVNLGMFTCQDCDAVIVLHDEVVG